MEFLKKQSNIKCVCCKSNKISRFNWDFSGENNSIFNYKANFNLCYSCGHLFISNISQKKLDYFYNFENPKATQATRYSNKLKVNQQRYNFYIKNIPFSKATSLCDVGCGNGDFLKFLKLKKEKLDLVGIDHLARNFNVNKKIEFINSNLSRLEVKQRQFDIVTCFHVLEHVKSIKSVINKILKLIKVNGHLIIEIPNAFNYENSKNKEMYWLSIREHVHHFNRNSIIELLNSNLEIKKIIESKQNTPGISYPSILVIAKKKKLNKKINILKLNKNKFRSFIEYLMRMNKNLKNINNQIKNTRIICFWGMSHLIYSLIPTLKESNFVLFDTNLSNKKVNNHIIKKPFFIENSLVIVTAQIHFLSIKKHAKKLGWKNNEIFDVGKVFNSKCFP